MAEGENAKPAAIDRAPQEKSSAEFYLHSHVPLKNGVVSGAIVLLKVI